MATKVKLLDAEKAKARIDRTQQRQIKDMYTQAAKELDKKIIKYSKRDNISSQLQKMQMQNLREQVGNELDKISNGIYEICTNSMMEVSGAVVLANQKLLVSMGFPEEIASNALMNVPQEVVKVISTGRVYDESWKLSEAIWGSQKKTQDTINQLIAIGTSQGSSSYDIAKLVESYVLPGAAKPSRPKTYYVYYDKNGNKVRDIRGLSEEEISKLRVEKKSFYIGKVDYNAQRLARTLVSHAYQQANIIAQKDNPWCEKFEWRSAMIHGRTCQICMDRDGQQYEKDKVPLDHPNGLCTIYPVLTKSLKDISKELADWVKSEDGTYPKIDNYAKSLFGGQENVEGKVKQLKSGFKQK